MPHSICTSDTGGELPYFQRLWRMLLAPNIDPQTRLEQLFDHETTEFDLDYAFLSYIDLERESERFDIVHGSHERLNPGATVPLSKTYCRKTITDPEGTMAISDALAEGWADDPAYETFELGSYLGTTISVDGELYGTLCFANTAARDDPIRDEEKTLIEMHGQWVAYTLELWGRLPTRGTRLDTVEGRTVSSDAIDSMMDALRRRPRREILIALLEDTTEISLDTIEPHLNDENAGVRLLHTDLPKLANAGYIKWDKKSETISEGPTFSEVEPLVQLLKEYNSAFSG